MGDISIRTVAAYTCALSFLAIAVTASGCGGSVPPERIVLVVVDTEDALLVVPRERAQEVRAVVEALRERGEEELL